MTQRDRTVLMVLGVLVVIAASWFLVLKPKRAEVSKLDGQIATAQQRLSSATASVAAAQQAKAQYARDYATVAKLGKAVPLDDDVPSLVYQLEDAAGRAKVDFRSIALSSSGTPAPAATNSTPAGQTAAVNSVNSADSNAAGTTTSTATTPAPATPTSTPVAATQTAAATLPPGASVGSAGFPTMPFDFTFTGRFFRLEDFLRELDRFTQVDGNGSVTVRGRLMTVDAFSLSAAQEDFPNMTAQIHATAYLLPRDQGLTAGATPTAPAGTPTATTASAPAPTTSAEATR